MTQKRDTSGGGAERPQADGHEFATQAEGRLMKILMSIQSSGAQGKISEGRASELAELLVQAVRDFHNPEPRG